MNLRTKLLCGLAAIVTCALAAQAQVPGVNSTLNSVFTLAYDNSTMKQTFSAVAVVSPAYAGAQEVCTITGSATKSVRIRRVIFSGYSSAVMVDPVAITKRSTATADASGGITTSALLTNVPYDSNNSAATAVTESWAANGSPGTLVGVLSDIYYVYGNATTGVGAGVQVFTFGQLGQPVVLRSAAEQLSLSLNGFVAFAGRVQCVFEWTEE